MVPGELLTSPCHRPGLVPHIRRQIHCRWLAVLDGEPSVLSGNLRPLMLSVLQYFGRDALIALRLLMPTLTSEAIESALGAVIERTNATGALCHEETIGEGRSVENWRRSDSWRYRRLCFLRRTRCANTQLDAEAFNRLTCRTAIRSWATNPSMTTRSVARIYV